MSTPSPYLHHRLIVGYHGCDRSTAERVLLTGEYLRPSSNPFDWLGSGIYFWEHGHQRAWEFAREQQKRGKVREPAVIGAYLALGRCFDLTDTWATGRLADYYPDLVTYFSAAAEVLPENRAGRPGDHDLLLRDLDCALVNLCLSELNAQLRTTGSPVFQTVRGVFVGGRPAYPGGRIFTKTHVQVAVRDPTCILGYFMPTTGYTLPEEVP